MRTEGCRGAHAHMGRGAYLIMMKPLGLFHGCEYGPDASSGQTGHWAGLFFATSSSDSVPTDPDRWSLKVTPKSYASWDVRLWAFGPPGETYRHLYMDVALWNDRISSSAYAEG